MMDEAYASKLVQMKETYGFDFEAGKPINNSKFIYSFIQTKPNSVKPNESILSSRCSEQTSPQTICDYDSQPSQRENILTDFKISLVS